MQLNMNLEQVTFSEGKLDLIPAGEYTATVSEVEAKELKTGNGHALEIFFKVANGEQAGKVISANLCISHTNQDTQKWALSDLKKILTYGGHRNPNFLADTDEMLGLTINIVVEESTYEKKDGGTGKSNDIKRYKSAGAATPGGTVVAAQPVAAPVAPAVGTPANPFQAAAPAAAPIQPPVIAAPAAAPAAAATTTPGAFPWGAPK